MINMIPKIIINFTKCKTILYRQFSYQTQFQTTIFASADTSNVGDDDGDVLETKLSERQQKYLTLSKSRRQ